MRNKVVERVSIKVKNDIEHNLLEEKENIMNRLNVEREEWQEGRL